MSRQDFKDVKVGDQLLVERHHYSEREAYTGKVTKVTATRFTVEAACFGRDNSQVFTKEGDIYPRPSGYGRLYTKLSPMDDAAKLLIKKYNLGRKARRLADQLGEIFSNSNYRRNMADMNMSIEELDESIKMLETTLERFKKYAKEEA